MKTPQHITDLLRKPMDRRDFLKHLAVGALLISGGGFIAKSLGLPQKLGFGEQQPQSVGYGSAYGTSAYGGARRQA